VRRPSLSVVPRCNPIPLTGCLPVCMAQTVLAFKPIRFESTLACTPPSFMIGTFAASSTPHCAGSILPSSLSSYRMAEPSTKTQKCKSQDIPMLERLASAVFMASCQALSNKPINRDAQTGTSTRQWSETLLLSKHHNRCRTSQHQYMHVTANIRSWPCESCVLRILWLRAIVCCIFYRQRLRCSIPAAHSSGTKGKSKTMA
jgi:hypothetical protein